MITFRSCLVAMQALAFVCCLVSGVNADDEWQSLFDGQTLEGWDGDPQLWSVEDGAITGKTTPETQLKQNSFIIWRGGEVANFELELEYRIVEGNSGIQYRSFEVEDNKWVVGGYQADFEAGDRYSGILYGERFRGILADRGQKTEITRTEDKKKIQINVVGSVGDSNEIGSKIKKEDWNDYLITAKDFHFVHKINGVTTCEATDNEQQRRESGILALQLHAGPPMKVQFRNIQIRHTKKPAKKTAATVKKK